MIHPDVKATYRICFLAHIELSRVRDMTTSLASFGPISIADSERVVDVDVRKPRRIDDFRRQLTKWERWGFVRWSEKPDPEQLL